MAGDSCVFGERFNSVYIVYINEDAQAFFTEMQKPTLLGVGINICGPSWVHPA